jgi:Tol biopolymer transport system component
MKQRLIINVILLFILITRCTQKNEFPVLRGPYLGQESPGMIPEVFAKDLLSIDENSLLGISVTPDGKEIYYTLFKAPGMGVIMYTKIEKGKWTKPKKVSFSSEHSDWDINLSPDGNTLYFSSMRPVPNSSDAKKNADIWFVRKTSTDTWSEPRNLGPPVNSNLHEVHPTISNNGNIYFFSRKKGEASDIYCSKLANNGYTKSEKLGSSINTEYNEADPFIASDDSYIIFQSKRPGGYGNNDLYISFRNEDQTWCNAINMGARINSEESDKCGRVTHDGKYFIFSRSKEGSSISYFYWVDAKIIEDVKPENLK